VANYSKTQTSGVQYKYELKQTYSKINSRLTGRGFRSMLHEVSQKKKKATNRLL